MGFIYKLTFPSEKSYIGQTIQTIEKRFQAHQYASKCVAVRNAIKKYGWENVKKEWYEIPDEDLNFYEEMLVALLGTLSPGGYNLREGGGSTGKFSDESKQKISEANLGRTHTEESKQKIGDARIGKTLSEDTKQKMSKAKSGEKHPMYGKMLSEETKKKMSEAQTGEKHHASKKVYQYTIDGAYVDSFASSGEAARAIGKSNGPLIASCARGDRKSAYGFKWTRTKTY